MRNTPQANPSKAQESSVWPDWNGQHGKGTDSSEVESGEAEYVDFNEVHKSAKEGEAARRESGDAS